MSMVPIAQVSPYCLRIGKNLGAIELDALAAEVLGDLGRLIHVPVLLETPVDDRLFDPAVFHGVLRGWRILRVQVLGECGHAEDGRAGRAS